MGENDKKAEATITNSSSTTMAAAAAAITTTTSTTTSVTTTLREDCSRPAFPVQSKESSPTSAPNNNRDSDKLLPPDFKVSKFDVINGRGRKSYNHIGNRRFRQMAAMNLKRYVDAKSKMDKTLVVISIVDAIREGNPCGGFVKLDRLTNRWISVGDSEAREKVGHCLRDMIASTKLDPRSRKQQLASQQQQPLQPLAPQQPASQLQQHKQQLKTKKQQQQQQQGSMISTTINFNHDAVSRIMSANNAINNDNNPLHHSALPPPQSAAMKPKISLSTSTIKSTSRGTQDMSEEQKRILQKLESGFTGTVAQLLGKH